MQSFRKGEVLSHERLNELLGEMQRIGGNECRVVPGVARAGAVYGPAWFNDDAVDACSGVALPDVQGLLAGVTWAELGDDALRVRDGMVSIPMAEDFDITAEGCDGEVEEVTRYWPGGMRALDTAGGIKRAQIHRGVGFVPYAHSAWEGCDGVVTPGVVHGVVFGECEAPCLDQGRVMIPYADVQGCGGVVTPGVLRGVRYDPDATQPRIDEGVLVLQLSGDEVPLADSAAGVVGSVGSVEYGSTTGKPQISQGQIQIPVAHYDGCIGAVGVIAGIKRDYGYEPMICDGVISLPFAPLGLADSCGGLVKWLDLKGSSLVRIKDGGADHLGYSAQILPNGALDIYVDRQ